jgi:hypothetical protein
MANSLTDLYNQAVSASGGEAEITDPTENSREANLCRLWYEVVRDNVVQTGPWSSAQTNKRLALFTERDVSKDWTSSDPAPGWLYAYALPSDLLRPRYLHSYAPFERQSIGGTTYIMTNQKDAVLHYTKRVEDVSKWDNELYLAVMYSLAAHISFPLSKKVTLQRELQAIAADRVSLAQMDVANEQHSRAEAMPLMLSVRGYGETPNQAPYSYPFATLNSVGA